MSALPTPARLVEFLAVLEARPLPAPGPGSSYSTGEPISSKNAYRVTVIKKVPSEAVYKQVEHFCFPDLDELRYSATASEYVFVLTDAENRRQFGLCRRVWHVDASCRVYLALTYWAEFDALFRVLQRVEELVRAHSDAVLDALFARLAAVALAPGVVALPAPFDSVAPLRLAALTPNSLGEPSLRYLLEALGTEALQQLLSALLTERRILFHARDLARLSFAVLGALHLLHPFQWQFILVPILPRSLITYCCAPMPFVLGVHSSYLSEVKKLPLEEVTFVDLDHCAVSAVRELHWPHALTAPLHTAVARAAAAGWEHRDTAVKAAAAELLVKLLGSYLWFFDTTPQGEVSFNRELLLRSIADFDSREIVRHFIQTQIFEEFISERKRALQMRTLHTLTSDFDRAALKVRESGSPPSVDADMSLSATFSFMKSVGRNLTKNIKLSLGDLQQKVQSTDLSLESVRKSLNLGAKPDIEFYTDDDTGSEPAAPSSPMGVPANPGHAFTPSEKYSDEATPPRPNPLLDQDFAPRAQPYSDLAPAPAPANTPTPVDDGFGHFVQPTAPYSPNHIAPLYTPQSAYPTSPYFAYPSPTPISPTPSLSLPPHNPATNPFVQPLYGATATDIPRIPPPVPVRTRSKLASASESELGAATPKRNPFGSPPLVSLPSPSDLQQPKISPLLDVPLTLSDSRSRYTDDDLNDPFLTISQRNKPSS